MNAKLVHLAGAVLSAATLLVAAPGAHAQPFPNKIVHLVVPFQAGTGSDVLARLVTPRLSELLGQNVIVENRPGGGSGSIAFEALAKTPNPDGYTLLVGTNAQILIAQAIQGNKLPYNTQTDFVALGAIARTPMVLVVSASDKAPKNIGEFISSVKAGKSNFSSPALGGFGHLVAEVLMYQLGAKATHIAYRGSAQSLTDVSTGEILFATDSPAAALALIRGNRLRPIAMTGASRSAALPNVPTFEELGVKGMNIAAWFAVFGASKMPAEAISRLRTEIAKLVREDEYRAKLAPMSLEPYVATPETFERAVRDELPFWEKFVKDSGVKVD